MAASIRSDSESPLETPAASPPPQRPPPFHIAQLLAATPSCGRTEPASERNLHQAAADSRELGTEQQDGSRVPTTAYPPEPLALGRSIGASPTSAGPGLPFPYFYPCPYPSPYLPYYWGHPVPLTGLSMPLHGVARQTRRRKARTVFSSEQMATMERKFAEQKYLSIPARLELAQDLCLSEQQVKTWFQNRRTKWKKEMSDKDRAEKEQSREPEGDKPTEVVTIDSDSESDSQGK